MNGEDMAIICAVRGYFFAAWIASGPQYEVFQLLVSIRLAPIATRVAQGCVRVRAFIPRLLLCAYPPQSAALHPYRSIPVRTGQRLPGSPGTLPGTTGRARCRP